MTLWAAIAAVIVLSSVMSVSMYLRRLIGVFSFAFATLLLIHYQSAPGESASTIALLGGGLAMTRPLQRLLRLRIF